MWDIRKERPDDTRVQAQHDETGRFWYGELKDLPPRYEVFNSETAEQYNLRKTRPAPNT